jgi:hypothetical protein
VKVGFAVENVAQRRGSAFAEVFSAAGDLGSPFVDGAFDLGQVPIRKGLGLEEWRAVTVTASHLSE